MIQTRHGPPTLAEHEVRVQAERLERIGLSPEGSGGPTADFTSLGAMLPAVRERLDGAALLTQAEAAEEARAERIAAGVCPQCDGARFVRVGDFTPGGHTRLEGADIALVRRIVPCGCAGAVGRAEWLRRSELPAGQHGWTFATFPADGRKTEARDRVARWVEAVAEGGTDSLVIAGSNGVGKTGLASAAVNALCDHGVAVRFAYVPGLLQEIRRRFGGEGDEATEYLERLLLVPVLVLDDLAAPNLTPWVRETITRIIAERLMGERPTLITLDESEEWIGDNFHPRVASRLKLFGVVTVPGADLRERTQRERWWA